MVLSMDRWKGKVAVVTGASVGIGAEIVKQLIDIGLKVVGLARRKEKLDELQKALAGKSGKFYAVSADVSKEEDIIRAFKWIKENVGPVHILVNNAGILRTTTLMDGDAKMWKDVFDTNVLGLSIATREAIRDMKSNQVDGHIVHINSMFGHKVIDIPNFNVYAASKHAVTALTETLRQELNSIKSRIKISSVSPGLVATEILTTGASMSGQKIEQKVSSTSPTPILQARDIADAVIYVLSTPPDVQVHDLLIKPLGEMS